MKHERNLLSVPGRRVATIVVIVLALLGLALAAAVPTLAAPPASFPVIIRLVPDAALRADLGGPGRTGIADLDARLAQAGAIRVAPALRFPPAADTEPARRLRRSFVVDCASALDTTAVVDLLAQSPAVPIARRTWVRPESTPRPNGGNENGSLHRPFDTFDEGIAVIGQ